QAVCEVESEWPDRGPDAEAGARRPPILVALGRPTAQTQVLPLEVARPGPDVSAVEEHRTRQRRNQREAELEVGDEEQEPAGSIAADDRRPGIPPHRGGAAGPVQIVEGNHGQGARSGAPIGPDAPYLNANRQARAPG